MLTRIRGMLSQLVNVPSSDPEDARRRKLLNILLISLELIVILLLFTTTVTVIFGVAGQNLEVSLLFGGLVVALVGILIIFAINRYYSGWAASVIFITFFVLLATFSDVPQEVVVGRSVFIFTIPILMASVLLRPYASFIFAGLCGLVSAGLALSIGIVPNLPAIFGFVMVAAVSWLSARSLEQALRDLRIINHELDERVAQRTRDLSEALAREQLESGKNQAILKSIADGVVVFDNHQRAIVANPSIEPLIGLPLSQILRADIRTLMADKVDEADKELALRALNNDGIENPNTKLRWGTKTLSVSFAPVRTQNGSSIGSVMVCRDFTREAELDRMKSAFLSMTSHELRTPLNAILGYADMLLESVLGPLEDQQRMTVERMMANTKRMLSLVNNLLDQAQMEAGKLTLHFEPFDVRELVHNLESVATVLAAHKGLKFTCQIEDVPDTLLSDARRLDQILLNLVGNAIKFTRQGSVSVRIYQPDAAHWGIEVSDTGPGIPPEAHSYIFEPFRQVDDPITRENTGSGLGLSIVKQLTSLLHGEISLKSAVGQGSTFIIILPLDPIGEAQYG